MVCCDLFSNSEIVCSMTVLRVYVHLTVSGNTFLCKIQLV